MKLTKLKQKVYEAWERLSTYQMAIVQPENFKPEMKTYGDLRRKVTWEKALAVFEAKNIWSSNSDNGTLIRVMLNYHSNRWDYEYRHQIFEQFIAIPGAIECIKDGLEQIFGYYEPSEAKEKTRGIFELVQGARGATAADGTTATDLRIGIYHQHAEAN